MQLIISDTTSTGEIREKFSKRFPFLRLDFFSVTNDKIIFDAAHRINDDLKMLGEIRTKDHNGIMVISGSEKVSTLEHTFLEHFGIAAQVSRKSGKIWVLTTSTDDLSLNQQNALGEEMSKAAAEKKGEREEKDLYEQE